MPHSEAVIDKQNSNLVYTVRGRGRVEIAPFGALMLPAEAEASSNEGDLPLVCMFEAWIYPSIVEQLLDY